MTVRRPALVLLLGLHGAGLASEPADPDHRPAYALRVDGGQTLALACGLTVPKIKDARGFPHGGVSLSRPHPCDDDCCAALDLWRADQFVAAWRDPGTNVVTLLKLSYPFPYALQPEQRLPPHAYFRDARPLAAAGYPSVAPEHVQDWLHHYYRRGATGAVPFQASSAFARLDAIESCERIGVETDGRPRLVYVFKLREDAQTPHPLDLWYALEIRSESDLGSAQEAFAESYLKALYADPAALVAERAFWAEEPFDTFARANAVRGVRNLGGEWQVFDHGPFCLLTDNPSAFACAQEGLEAQQRAYDLFDTVLLPFGPAALGDVCVIRVYATGWEFEDSVSRTRRWAGGMYLPGIDEIVMRGWSRGGTVHEITHRYLRVACGRRGLSVWFNEGFACYLGGCTVSDGRLVPPPVSGACLLLVMLEQGDLRVVADVFTVEDFYQDKAMERNPQDPVAALKRAKNYAAAWGVIYFLREAPALYPGKGYETLIPLYWEALQKTGDPGRATEVVLDALDLPSFLADFKQYFQSQAEAGDARAARRSGRLVTEDEHGELLPRERRFDFAPLLFGDAPDEVGRAPMRRGAVQRRAQADEPSANRTPHQKGGSEAAGAAAPHGRAAAGRKALAAAVAAAAGLALAWGWRRRRGGRLFGLALLLAAGAARGDGAETNGYTLVYRVVGDAAVVGDGESCAVSPKPKGAFAVPPTLDGRPVVAVSAYAFAECEELTDLSLPKSVTEIGPCAFHSCRTLKTLPLPDAVTELGEGAFFLCAGLERVALPPRVASVPAWAFGRCFRLTSVTFGDGVRSIGCDAFLGCAALDRVELPEAVADVGDRAFKWCSSLRSAALKGPVRALGRELFAGCSSLADVALPATVTGVGDGAFRSCVALRGLKLPPGVTQLGSHAFYGCTRLASADLPDAVTEIGSYAFAGCVSLERAEFSEGLAVVGSHAFDECHALSSLVFPPSVLEIRDAAFARCASLFSVTLPASLPTLEREVFRDCTGLASVTLPPALNAIGEAAFGGCANLSAVRVPDSVRSVGGRAFAGCAGLRQVRLGRAVARLGAEAFSGCESLPAVELPASVKSVGNRTFARCARLTDVRFLGDAPAAGADLYAGTSERLTSCARPGAKGWPATSGEWRSRPFRYRDATP